MEKRLAQVATELNVGISHLADFLKSKGILVNASPATKISGEAYSMLVKQFQKDAAIKQEAEKLNVRPISSTPKKVEDEVVVVMPPVPKQEPLAVVKEKVVEATPPQPQPVVVEEKPVTIIVKEEPKPQPVFIEEKPIPVLKEEKKKPDAVSAEPKVSGSDNDTSQNETDIKKDTSNKDKQRDKKVVNPITPVIEVPIQKVETPTPEVLRAKAPELMGPKILGKINLDRHETSPEEKAKREKERKEKERKERKERERKEKERSLDFKKRQEEKRSQEKQNDTPKNAQKTVKQEPSPSQENVKEEDTPRKEQEVISANRYQLTAPKVLGRIDLPTTAEAPKEDPKKRKRKRKKVATAKPGEQQPKAETARVNQNSRPIEKIERKPSTNDRRNDRPRPTTPGEKTGNDRPIRPANNNNAPVTAGGGVNKPGTSGGGAGGRDNGKRGGKGKDGFVSKKEVDSNIRTTMDKLRSGSKSNRNKIRRDANDKRREKAAENEIEDKGILQITDMLTVQEFANLMDVTASQVIMTCMALGKMMSINQRFEERDILELVGEEFGFKVEFIAAEDNIEIDEDNYEDDPADIQPRAPIVTVMGHVDHGKTSLLDYIRKASIADGEAGGITQHLGAYEAFVTGEGGERKKIVFLDTPGHEAFTAMRARGTKVTDIAIIIIAADDAIMPTTREAISHAQAGGVPMIFAINKIDKEGANPEKIREQLAAMNILVEEWGGTYQCQEIAAKKGINIDKLLEKILLEAEMLELTANAKRPAEGTVLEASMERGRGYVTKMLVSNGTLRKGDMIWVGEYACRVRNMFDERNKVIKEAGPATPVLVLGLSGAPAAGERFKVLQDESKAKELAQKRLEISRSLAVRAQKRLSLEEIARRLALGNFQELKLIVKGDFDGSVEALSDSLLKLSTEQVKVSIIHRAVGQITESDVNLASASDAIIIGFHVRPSSEARKRAEQDAVQIKTYNIIYEVIDEIKSAMEGMLSPTREEKIVGTAQVLQVFKVNRVGTIAGCLLQDGKMTRSTKVRVIRNGIVVFPVKENAEGELTSLKRFKDDVKEVLKGYEFGTMIKDYNDLEEGDIIEGYEIIETKQKL